MMSLLFCRGEERKEGYLWESLLVWGRAVEGGGKSGERKGRVWDRGGGGDWEEEGQEGDGCALLQGVGVGVRLSTQMPRIQPEMRRMHTLLGLGEP